MLPAMLAQNGTRYTIVNCRRVTLAAHMNCSRGYCNSGGMLGKEQRSTLTDAWTMSIDSDSTLLQQLLQSVFHGCDEVRLPA
jgi:hypothetical protein